jgi:hypothetical protein
MTDPLQEALTYAENIIATLREPFVVLDKTMRVRTANAAFYRDFHASKEETEGHFVYELGNGQWDIPEALTPCAERYHTRCSVRERHLYEKRMDCGQHQYDIIINAVL